MPRLSKTIADNASPQATRYTIWDTDLPGFGMRVEPSGTQSWIVRYRGDGGGRNAAQRLVSLGRVRTVSASKAREEATKILAAVALGHDPASAIAQKRREMRMVDLIALYERDGLHVQRGKRIGTPMKPLTAKYTVARLRNHVVPLLGQRRANEITEGDIEAFARAVGRGDTASDEHIAQHTRRIVKGGEGAARKVVRDLSAVFGFAMRHRIVTSNPVAAAGVRKTDNQRDRYLTLEEIRRLGAALEGLADEGVNSKAINIARLWALSGCRRNEIAGLRWSEVDCETGMLCLSESKTGRNKRPLGAAAIALLNALKPSRDINSDFVFPAERGFGFYQGTKRVWQEAVRRADLPGITPYTLRHTLGALAASTGEALLMIGSLLGHANARSTAIYAHVAHDPARLAADRVTDPIALALTTKGLN